MNRVFFVQNKNPDDYDDQDEVNKCKKDNKKMAQKIIKSLRERGNETVNLREKYKTLTEEFDKLMTAKDKKGMFITEVDYMIKLVTNYVNNSNHFFRIF